MTSDISPAPVVYPGLPASVRAPVVLLPARIADAADVGEARDTVEAGRAIAERPGDIPCPTSDILGERAARLAAAFAEAGWDIAFYGVAPTGGDARMDLTGSARADAIRAGGAQAGRVPRLAFLVFDATTGHAGAAASLIADSAAHTAFGVLPRCLVLAPSSWPHAVGEEAVGATPARAPSASAHGSDALRWDSVEINAFHQTNVTAPLCLARAHHAAWYTAREGLAVESADALARYAAEDASVVVLLDAVGLQRHVDIDRIPYATSQAALHATIPSLARAFAPGMRVTAVSAPLWDQDASRPAERARADTALAQALCYVAEANTITGATLQLNGAANQIVGSE